MNIGIIEHLSWASDNKTVVRGRGASVSEKDLSIRIQNHSRNRRGNRHRLAFTFRNGLEEEIFGKEEYNRRMDFSCFSKFMFFKSTDNGWLLTKNGGKKANRVALSITDEEMEKYRGWVGDYDMDYDKESGLYFIVKDEKK